MSKLSVLTYEYTEISNTVDNAEGDLKALETRLNQANEQVRIFEKAVVDKKRVISELRVKLLKAEDTLRAYMNSYYGGA